MNVAATMAIEKMYISKEFIMKLILIYNKEINSKDLRKEIIKNY